MACRPYISKLLPEFEAMVVQTNGRGVLKGILPYRSSKKRRVQDLTYKVKEKLHTLNQDQPFANDDLPVLLACFDGAVDSEDGTKATVPVDADIFSENPELLARI
ncbi:hypothetical protein QFX18_14710 [Saccharophagus degradans]|uniref:hypothetical protein n=1 Tax=Saccharophagus degradans TaxID=86304 RepID=UPI0024781200|nr:hypothetical protein [Saccharophagus degradans]WGO97289.1 hypothetical protein QFX18_14710 [Saccharophagus degradans]